MSKKIDPIPNRLETVITDLTPFQRMRAESICMGIPSIVGGLKNCAGPDDAMIAVAAALITVWGFFVPGMTAVRAAEISFEFVLDEVQKRK